MFPVSARFLDVITGSHRAIVKARLLTTTQFGATPVGLDLPILGGNVKMSSTADVKATLELTVPGDYLAQVTPYGAEVWIARGVAFGDDTEELVPLGYFRIDEIDQEDAPYGPVRLSCTDRTSQIMQNRVLYPFQIPTGTTHRQLFERLVNGRVASVGTVPAQTQAAQYIFDRLLLGQPVAEDWTWADAPAVVGTYNDALLALWEADGAIPAQTMAAILIDYRILCHAPIGTDWTWSGASSVVTTYAAALQTLWNADGSPEPTTWLQTYVTAHGGTMPTQTQAAGIIKARLESGLTISEDWTWPDPPQIVGLYNDTIQAQYPGAWNDRPTAIAWLGSYISTHGGGGPPDPITWLQAYIAANGGDGATNSIGYAALIQGPPIPIVWTGYDPDRYTVDGGQVVEDSTYEFLAKLVDDRGCVLRFDEYGQLNIDVRDPDPDAAPIYVIAPGRTGNLIKAGRKISRDGVYNIVVAHGSDPATPTGYALSYNTDPNSPLRWDGLFGPAPRHYASPLLRTPDAAAQAAASILSRYTGLPTTVGLWTLPNPALRPNDMVSAAIEGLPQKHLIDTVTIPLSSNEPVQIDTKTTNSVVEPDEAPTPTPTPDAGFTKAQRDQEKAFELTSTAENSTIRWWEQYGYIENIGDGRGLTGGIVGFTSATADMEDMVKNYYVPAVPTAALASFLTGLHACTVAGEGDPGATNAANTNLGSTYITAWKAAAANDAAFRTAQRTYREQNYWAPAFAVAQADGLGALGAAVYWDTYVNHGPGDPSSGDGSFEDIRSQMTGSAPSAGGNETTWLTQFLSHRSTVLTAWGDNPPDGRISMFTAILGTGNLGLTTPLSWSVYGDSFTMPTDPDPYREGTSATPTAFANPGAALNIGKGDTGFNHVNIGIGFAPGSRWGAAAVHKDFTQDQIQAGFSEPGYYELLPSGRLRMTVPLDGGRTSDKTRYARVEHRGLNPDGTKQSFGAGVRAYIKCRTAVPKLPPSKPETVVLQFHDADDDTAMIHIQNGLVRAKIRGAYVATLEASWDRQMKDAMIEVLPSGRVNFYWGSLTTVTYFDDSFAGKITGGWYAKGGNYMQSWARSPGDTTSTRDGAGPTDAYVDSPGVVEWEPDKFEIWQTGWAAPQRLTAPVGGSPGSGGGTGGTPSTGGTGGTPTPTDDGTEAAKVLGWGPVIDGDEFEYTGPPRSDKWSMYDGPGHDGNGTRDPSAFNVAGGVLTCTGTAGGSTGGMAFSRETKFVRIEWRVRTYSINPAGSGNRYHPVLIMWPTSDRWPQDGEYDFYECDCDTGKYEHYEHIPGNDGSAQEYDSMALDIQNWHNIAFEWSKTGIKGFVDGRQIWAYSGSYILAPDTMHPTFQMDNFFGSKMEPAKFEAKWCRIYASPS